MAVFIKKVNIPQKSDLINIDMTGSGTPQTYRVLKNVSDQIVEVLGMTDINDSFSFGSSQIYANSSLDTYLNSTWYNTLSSTAKTAIVDKTFRQDSWYRNATGSPKYEGKYGTNSYQVSLSNTSFGNEITRHCYALSVQDIIDYLEVTTSMTFSDTTLNDTNILQMFWNNSTTISKNIWFYTADAAQNNQILVANGNVGNIGQAAIAYSRSVRPAFQIDLSKIDYTFADGRIPVELKPVSILQKSSGSLNRVSMSYKVPATWSVTVTISNNTISLIGCAEDPSGTNAQYIVEPNTSSYTFDCPQDKPYIYVQNSVGSPNTANGTWTNAELEYGWQWDEGWESISQNYVGGSCIKITGDNAVATLLQHSFN